MEKTKQKTRAGSFFAFEGIDGSGKSTQIRLLADRLKEEGVSCYLTREPTDGPVGALLHQIMMGRIRMDPQVIAGLFVADRLDHLVNETDGILAKVQAGATVLTDRYYFSSYAYQCGDMPMDWIIRANSRAKELLKPAATIFIDLDPELAMERIERNRDHKELFEEKERLIRVRENYLEAFAKCPDETVIFVDGSRPQEEIAADIWEKVRGSFGGS